MEGTLNDSSVDAGLERVDLEAVPGFGRKGKVKQRESKYRTFSCQILMW